MGDSFSFTYWVVRMDEGGRTDHFSIFGKN